MEENYEKTNKQSVDACTDSWYMQYWNDRNILCCK